MNKITSITESYENLELSTDEDCFTVPLNRALEFHVGDEIEQTVKVVKQFSPKVKGKKK